jgi:hypothetical protein
MHSVILRVRFVGAPSERRPRRERLPVGRVAATDIVVGVSAILTLGSNQNSVLEAGAGCAWWGTLQPLPRFTAAGLARRFTGCAPALSGGIAGIPLAGGTGGRMAERGFGMSSKDALSLNSNLSQSITNLWLDEMFYVILR